MSEIIIMLKIIKVSIDFFDQIAFLFVLYWDLKFWDI